MASARFVHASSSLSSAALCLHQPGEGEGGGGEDQERRRKGVRKRKKERGSRVCLTGFSSLVCVKWKDEGGERHDVKP